MNKSLKFLIFFILIFIIQSVCYGRYPELILQTGHSDYVKSLAFSPDGKILASGSGDKTVKIWSMEIKKEICTLKGHEEGILSVAFSPKGKILATGSLDKSIRIWNLENGKELFSIKGHSGAIYTLAFSPDGNILASGSDDKTVKLWDVKTGKEIMTMKGHNDIVSSVSFSPDGKTIATGSYDGKIILWDRGSGKIIKTIEGPGPVVFSPDGKSLVFSTSDNTIKVRDITKGIEVFKLSGHNGQIQSLCFNSNGKILVSGSEDNTIKIWNMTSGKEIRTLKGEGDMFLAVAISPDGKTLASGNMGGAIQIWNITIGNEICKLEAYSLCVNTMAMSPDGKTLASGSWENKIIKIWNMVENKGIHNLRGHSKPILSLTFGPEGKILVSGSRDNTIRVWEMDSRKILKTITGYKDSVSSVAISPDGKILAGGSSEGYNQPGIIKLWDLSAGRELKVMKGHTYSVTSLSFSPDGKTLASGSDDNTIKLWELSSGKEIMTLKGHKDWVKAVVFSPDGKILASGSFDNTIKLWDVEKGREIRTLIGHTLWVEALSFSPDGKILASGSRDKTAKLWDWEKGKEISTLLGHTDGISSVVFKPDGKIIATGSWDSTIKLWTDNGQELATLISFEEKDNMVEEAVGYGKVTLCSYKEKEEFQGHRDWLVVTPEGFFDGTTDGMKKIIWRLSDNILDIAEPEQYFNEFYQPGLLQDIYKNEKPLREILKDRGDKRSEINISEKDRRLPGISIKSSDTAKDANIDVTIYLKEALTDKTHKEPGVIKDVRLFRNGTLVKFWQGEQKEKVLTCNIPVVSGENLLTAYAFNKDNVKSKDAVFIITGEKSLFRPGKAYVLSIGINKYANPDYNLNFAGSDALSLGEALKKNLPFQENNIHIETLLDERATKNGIISAINEAGKKAGPEDTLILTYAGHGINYKDKFYLIPYDLESVEESKLLSTGISDDELGELILPVQAKHIVLILDACYSGQALESEEWRTGPVNSRSLAQLAWEKGMEILTASQSQQAAIELSKLGHGLLTYTLIQGFNDAPRTKNNSLLVRDWLEYAVTSVPLVIFNDPALKDRTINLTILASSPEKLIPVQIPRVFYKREGGGRWVISGKL